VNISTCRCESRAEARGGTIEAGAVDLSAGNITIERCWLHPLSIGRGMPLVQGEVEAMDGPNVIRDSDIDGSALDPAVYTGLGTSAAVSTGNIRIERCNIHHFGSGVAFWGSEAVALECSYIHDLIDTEYNPGEWSHTDGFTIRGFSGTEAVVQFSRISAYNDHCTGAVFMQATWADSFFDDIRYEGDLLEGNGYNLVIERSNGGYGTNIRAVNNRFTVNGFGVGYVEHGPGWAEWRENYLNDPAQDDHRGEPAEEPMTGAAAGMAPPSGLQAAPASGSSLSLSWSDNSDNEMGFRIERSPDGVTFFSITISDADASSYVDSGLPSDTTYYYRIAAVNGDGMTPYSNTASAAL
jgi:hypothetical protein